MIWQRFYEHVIVVLDRLTTREDEEEFKKGEGERLKQVANEC